MNVGCVWSGIEAVDIDGFSCRASALSGIQTFFRHADGRDCHVLWAEDDWVPGFLDAIRELDSGKFRCLVASDGREIADLGSMSVRREDFEVLRGLVEDAPKIREKNFRAWEAFFGRWPEWPGRHEPFDLGENGRRLVEAAANLVEPESPKP